MTQSEETKKALEPCPFCGEKSLSHENFITDTGEYLTNITCDNCVFSGPSGEYGDFESVAYPTAVTAWNTRAALSQSPQGDTTRKVDAQTWQPIETAPDGRMVLTLTKIAMSGEYFEPEVLYRNGEYWFKEPGMRSFAKPSLWMHLPPAPASDDGVK